MPTPRVRVHTDGLVAWLEAADLLVGRGKRPIGGGWSGGEPGAVDFAGYVVVYPMPGQTQTGGDTGTIGDPHGSLLYTAQLTCVGAIEDQAEQIIDDVRVAVLGQRIPVANRITHPAYTVPGFDVPIRRDDQVKPAEFYAITQIRFKSDPAAG